MKTLNTFLILLVFGVFAFPIQGRAATQLSNFSYVTDPEDGNLVSEDLSLAQSFITGTTASNQWSVQSVVLQLITADPDTTGAFNVAIYDDDSNQPGALLASLTGENNPVTAGTYTYSAASLLLAGSTQYWIVATAADTPNTTTEYGWATAIGDDNGTLFTTQNLGWTTDPAHAIAAGNGAGTSWTTFLSAADNGGNTGFAINATAAPEPSTWALLVGGCGLFALRRRMLVSRKA